MKCQIVWLTVQEDSLIKWIFHPGNSPIFPQIQPWWWLLISFVHGTLGDFAVYEGSSFCTMPWVYPVKIYTIILTGLAGLAHLQWKKGLMGLEGKLKINPEEGNILIYCLI